MGVSEAAPLGGEPVDVRGLHLGGTITTEVPVPEIVGIDQNDVG